MLAHLLCSWVTGLERVFTAELCMFECLKFLAPLPLQEQANFFAAHWQCAIPSMLTHPTAAKHAVSPLKARVLLLLAAMRQSIVTLAEKFELLAVWVKALCRSDCR